MVSSNELTTALDAALVTARAEYRNAVVDLATREAAKHASSDREPADVEQIHHARTRVIALDAARDELSQMIEEGAPLGGA
ncbi:hypothetical protein [Sphingomonas sp. PAMC 26621]|uniref:hypothetical protein n=1 Tax=Sphingomonas sp. PAMC 26621 TaxID=1112213 RepID=UPI0002889033|nr:hypothetical protein [Sphingomonas sp. PAMC 26621]